MADEPMYDMDDEYEEISAIEVDRILAALDQLIESTESETIRSYLETTAEEISYLVDDEEEAEGLREAA